MSRAKKDSIPLNIRMKKDVHIALIDYCEETGLPKTTAVEQAVAEYLKRKKKAQKRALESEEGN